MNKIWKKNTKLGKNKNLLLPTKTKQKKNYIELKILRLNLSSGPQFVFVFNWVLMFRIVSCSQVVPELLFVVDQMAEYFASTFTLNFGTFRAVVLNRLGDVR